VALCDNALKTDNNIDTHCRIAVFIAAGDRKIEMTKLVVVIFLEWQATVKYTTIND